jgi:hypothetical protein
MAASATLRARFEQRRLAFSGAARMVRVGDPQPVHAPSRGAMRPPAIRARGHSALSAREPGSQRSRSFSCERQVETLDERGGVLQDEPSYAVLGICGFQQRGPSSGTGPAPLGPALDDHCHDASPGLRSRGSRFGLRVRHGDRAVGGEAAPRRARRSAGRPLRQHCGRRGQPKDVARRAGLLRGARRRPRASSRAGRNSSGLSATPLPYRRPSTCEHGAEPDAWGRQAARSPTGEHGGWGQQEKVHDWKSCVRATVP